MRTSRVPDPPPPGTIHLPTHLSASQIFHSLDESTRCQASHSPDSSSRWRNRYVDRPSGVQIHPASGEIWTYIHPRTVRFHPAGGGNGTFTCRVVSVWTRKRVGGEHGACHHDWEEHKAPVRIRLGGSHELCVSGRTVPSLRNLSMPILLFGDCSRMILNISGSATPVPVPYRIRAVINA